MILAYVRSALLYLWQLPQNILGLLLVFAVRAKPKDLGSWYRADKFGTWGVSLGSYIVFGGANPSLDDFNHEAGHQWQSHFLGWLYLPVIGLPSLCGNIYDRIAHKKWAREARIRWYYRQPWEAWADRLGGVSRY